MAGPYTFKIDRVSGTYRCLNGNGTEIKTGDTPLTDEKRLKAIFADHGVSDPTASAIVDYFEQNWTEETV